MQKLSWVNHHASENMKKRKLLLRLNKTRWSITMFLILINSNEYKFILKIGPRLRMFMIAVDNVIML